jgi:DNA adenine methylase
MMPHTTLIRYIGGKSELAPEIASYIRVPYTGVYCEPFVGGASVGILVASTTAYAKVRVILNDFDPEVANFWNQVINPNKADVNRFLDQIKACQPSLDLHDWMKKGWHPTDPIDRAFRWLFLNRASHIASHGKRPLGGRRQANPDSDIRSRFKVDNIIPEFIRVRRILFGRTIVTCKDFAEVLADAESDWVIYADPPYYDRNLYDVSFYHDDHVRLRDALMTTPADWVLSYQEHPTVLDLYRNATIHTREANHAMNKRKRNEWIIVPNR